MFGPSARPELPAGIDRKMAWKPDAEPHDRNRRSVYVFAKRNLRYPLLDTFDLPDLHNSCPRRSETTTAPQALSLLNGDFAWHRAQEFGRRLIQEQGGDLGGLVRATWLKALAREPSDEESSAALRFLNEQSDAIAAAGTPESATEAEPSPSEGLDPAQAAAVFDLCHALFNANEFLYVD
jgi:hypothetical protein